MSAAPSTATQPLLDSAVSTSVDTQLPRLQRRLGPHRLSDFIIHYRNTDFHVHAFVLCEHSAYFRNYLDTQEPLLELKAEVVEEQGSTKRRKVTAFTSIDICFKCGPSSITRCIDLPEQCGVEPASEEQFLLFLQHLYYPAILHSPPFYPRQSILDSLTEDTSVSLAFPVGDGKASVAELSLYASTGEATREALFWPQQLSLFHYFDCRQAMTRCEAIIQSVCELPQGTLRCLQWLQYAVQYGLHKVEAVCLNVIGSDPNLRLDNPKYSVFLRKLSYETLLKVVEAFSKGRR